LVGGDARWRERWGIRACWHDALDIGQQMFSNYLQFSAVAKGFIAAPLRASLSEGIFVPVDVLSVHGRIVVGDAGDVNAAR